MLLFPEAGTNVAARSGSPEHDEKLFDGCDVVVSGTLVSQRMAPCPLEPRSAAAEVGPDGRVTAWLSTQTPHQDRMVLAGMLGLDPAQVRVIAPDVGGGFGAKMLNVEEMLVVWLARKLGRPVRWTETRSESMVALPHGRAQQLDFTIGGTRDGKVLAYRLEVLQDARRVPGARRVPAEPDGADGERRLRDPADRVRGPLGGDEHDADLGLPRRGPARGHAGDRARDRHVRRRARDGPGRGPAEELHPEGRVPAHDRDPRGLRLGRLRGRARPRASLGRLRRAARRAAAPARAGRREAARDRHLAATSRSRTAIAETEFGEVEITADGGAIVRTGSFSHGQGHETTFAMIAAERLGLPVEKVTVLKGDTDEIAKGTGTYGSKSTQIGGAAARLAADDVVEQAKQLVADYLEASPDDIVLDPALGRLHVAGAPARVDLVGGARRARGRRRAARRAEGGARVPGRRRPSRSARTSPSSRSTRRRRRSSCCGSSPSTTRAR